MPHSSKGKYRRSTQQKLSKLQQQNEELKKLLVVASAEAKHLEESKSFFQDCLEFTRRRNQCINKITGQSRIDRTFIIQMVKDELQELAEAKNFTEEVDALVDIIYYCLQHLSNTGLQIEPIWNLVHRANMTKFGPGGYLNEIGKWVKPPNFIPPDEDIQKEIEYQIREFHLDHLKDTLKTN